MGKDKVKEKDKATEKDKDEESESCGKCHTYVKGENEIQGLRRNGQRQTQSYRKRQRRINGVMW